MKKIIVLAALALVPFAPAFGSELHYQSITAVSGDTIEITDRSPGGNTVYQCSSSGTCKTSDGNTLFEDLPNQSTYTKSANGKYGYQTIPLPYNGTTYTIIIFYELTQDSATAIDFTVASGTILKSNFSPSGEQFVMVLASGDVTMRDIKDHTTHSATIDQTELPFFIISEEGTYLSTYNYVSKVHKLLNIKSDTLHTVAGSAGYVAFNQSETKAAFSRNTDDFKNLYEVSLSDQTEQAIATGDFLVEDYLYANDTLYYTANKRTPLSWHLYDDTGAVIDTNVSYGDYLKDINGHLAYLKTTGKTTDVYLYKDETKVRLDAAPDSAAADIVRRETTIKGTTAAILTPKDGKVDDVFIWLHGGPQRQTSLMYHPYLSYAVYDELLEDIVAAGNLVIKLDYTGSWGYGQDYIDALSGKIGRIEMDDVAAAIDYAKDEYDVSDVYVIGNSYGGYMAFQAANMLTDDVDGIVSINGVSNWYSLMSQIPSSIFAPLFGGAPNAANLQTYLAASVFTNVDEIPDDLPLVTIYGTEDKTVPVAQSTEYEIFMKREGKNVLLTALAGEEHIIRSRENLDKMCAAIEDGLDLKYNICN